MKGLKVTAEIRRDWNVNYDYLRIDVEPKDRKQLSHNYPIDIEIHDDSCISRFEQIFEIVKMSFLEEIHKQQKQSKFHKEFIKDPEGYIERALKTKR